MIKIFGYTKALISALCANVTVSRFILPLSGYRFVEIKPIPHTSAVGGTLYRNAIAASDGIPKARFTP